MLLLWASSAWAAADDKDQKVVIPFDFVSKFDKGRYGKLVGDLIWKRLQRENRFVLPESMLDVRETCERNRRSPAPEMALDQVKKIVDEDFGGHVAIWGSVERVAGQEEDAYDLVIKCVDFTPAAGPKVLYECNAQTKTVSEIPHVYVKQMVDALVGRAAGGPAGPDAVAEANWAKNPNLVEGGDFESGNDGVPKGWEAVAGQQREPLGGLVRWTTEGGSTGNRIIRFTFGANAGDNEGVMYYSLPFPVDENAKYRFSVRWRSNGPQAKVFIKCYDQIIIDYVGSHRTSANASRLQDREVYRSQQNLKGPKDTWNVHTEDFTPKHTQYSPHSGRVMLYAYTGAGVVEFDDVVVKQIVPAPSKAVQKAPRRSSESKITIKDMEENQRRSKEAAEKSGRAKDE